MVLIPEEYIEVDEDKVDKIIVNEIKNRDIYVHRYTSGQKMAWWGHGEWVEEADEIYFFYAHTLCIIYRMCEIDKNGDAVGGNLIGCVCLPFSHPWIMDKSLYRGRVHGGIFTAQSTKDMLIFPKRWELDYVPYIHRKNLDSHKKSRKIYRNMSFMINECKNLVVESIECCL